MKIIKENILPNGDRLLVEKLVFERTSKGILIPKELMSKDNSISLGKIVKIGLGDKVKVFKNKKFILFSKFSGIEVISDFFINENTNLKYYLISYNDVLAVIL